MNPQTGVKEEVEGVLVAGIHCEVAGGEVRWGESIPGGAGFEEGLNSLSMAVLGGVHQGRKAIFIEAADVSSRVN